ncbi:MAG: S41 family peptidase [Candidatus Zixiibacteriota bacterium]
MKQFSLLVIAITAFMLGLIWAVGSTEATQQPPTQTLFLELADTVHFNLDQNNEINNSEVKPEDTRETLFKEIKKLNQTVYDIKNRYMEEINTEDIINAGIRGMLRDLDRYSVLMEQKSYERLLESTHGKYEGLGMEIDSRDDYITVVTPMEGTPAQEVGLHPGDQIIKIDGKSTYKMTTSDAASLMRGTAGTSVVLTIKRIGLTTPVDFEVHRAVIELKSVNYYGIVDGTNIGYVRLSRFAEETSRELRDAITELNNQNVDGLIFDLRSNGGGLLQQAVETAELFIDEDKLVVYTQGKFAGSEQRHYSKRPPIYPNKPLVMLVNEGTASASEIVSGAIQDWDRGIIMGRPTYGKGLVQQIFPIGTDDKVALKLTTAKYYIPSGRCIQKEEKQGKNHDDDFYYDEEVQVDTATVDTMNIVDRQVYYTNSGRAVYGGGGILPDVELEEEPYLTPIEINLERNRLFFDFAVNYVAENEKTLIDVEITDDIVKQFKEFTVEKDFTYKTALEITLEEMNQTVKDDNKEDIFGDALANFEQLIEKEKEADFEKSKDYIKKALKREIVSKIAGQRGVYEEVVLKTDKTVKAAIELLQNKDGYAKALTEGHVIGQLDSDEKIKK